MLGPMTERGLPIVDGPVACPFVAFEDDRDERATAPDHRHRCYAEIIPASRALAHQEAYCLSSAFPVCPTFQDWARREPARARDAAPTAPSASAGMNRAATGAVADAASDAASDAAAAGATSIAPTSGAPTAGSAAPTGLDDDESDGGGLLPNGAHADDEDDDD